MQRDGGQRAVRLERDEAQHSDLSASCLARLRLKWAAPTTLPGNIHADICKATLAVA